MADKNLELALRIRADLKQAQSSIEQFTQELENVEAAAEKSASGISKSEKSTSDLDKSQKQANTTTQQFTQGMEDAGSAATKSASSINKADQSTSGLSKTQQQTQTSVQQLTQGMEGIEPAANKSAAGLSRAEKSTSGLSNSQKQAQAPVRQFTKEMTGAGSAAGKSAAGITEAEKSTTGLGNSQDRAAKSARSLRRESDSLLTSLRPLAGAIAAAFSVREIARATEAYTTINNRLALVTNSSEELANAQDAVFQIAQNSRQSYEATAELYQRIATNADALQLSAAGVAGVVDTINKAMVISGTSGASASAALTQLGQAFASGVLRGEELNSVLEQAPALAKALADGMGVTVGELRQLGQDGKLTAQNVVQALQSQGAAIDTQFSKMSVTGSQAMTVLGNSLMRVIGQMDEAAGASSAFGNKVLDVSRWLDSGALTDGLLQSLSVWSGTFEVMAQDIESLGLDLQGLGESGDTTAQFLAKAFINLPVNLRAAIQLATVEILALFDRTIAYANYAWETIKNTFNDAGAEAAARALEARINAIDEVRASSIATLLDERDAILGNAEAERARQKAESEARKKARAEREKEIEKLRANAASRQVQFGPDKKTTDQAKKDLAELEKAQARLDQLMGNTVKAHAQTLQIQYKGLLDRLKVSNNQAGIDLINKLINVELAKTRLDTLQSEVQRVTANVGKVESSINVQQDAGLLTEVAARKKIVALHRQTAAELEKQRPLLQEMAEQPGAVGQAAKLALQALDDEILRLQSTMTVFESALKDGLQSGISDAIQGLADGTYTLRDAVTSLVDSVTDSMLRMASDGLAEMATNKIMGMFTTGAQEGGQAFVQMASQQTQAIQAVTTAQTTADTVRATSAIAATNTAVSGTAPAAAEATTLWTPSATAASVGSYGAAAAIGIAALLAVLAMAKGNFFASGGHVRGPGTATSDSIPAMLSDYEFVTRAAVVKQPGALGFLNDFNTHGMSALDVWAGRTRHATGGLAGVPAPSMPSPTLGASELPAPAKMGQSPNQMRVYVLQNEDELAQRLAQHPAMEKAVVAYAGSNGNAIKAEW